MKIPDFKLKPAVFSAALDELIREGIVERHPSGKYRLTEAGIADSLAKADRDPAFLAALNDELKKYGVAPIVPGKGTPQ